MYVQMKPVHGAANMALCRWTHCCVRYIAAVNHELGNRMGTLEEMGNSVGWLTLIFHMQNVSKQDCFLWHQWTANAGVQKPWQRHHQHNHQCTTLLWNPPRPSYHHQEKAFWHVHEGCHHVAWQHLSLCAHRVQNILCALWAERCWTMPCTALTCHHVTSMCSAHSRKVWRAVH